MILNTPVINRILLAIVAVGGFGLQIAMAQEAADQTAEIRDPYMINPGDKLGIVVWKEEDLQRVVTVRPDGAFSFPLAGDIYAEGKSVDEVRAIIEEKLSRYIPDLVVTVSTEELLGNKIYVIGQVNNPGQFIVTTYVDVTQALSIAGGANPFAKTNDIKILRRTNGRLNAIKFRYGDIEAGKRLEQNIMLKPGDIVVVP
jgi:polysaccharide export outer membrane protein